MDNNQNYQGFNQQSFTNEQIIQQQQQQIQQMMQQQQMLQQQLAHQQMNMNYASNNTYHNYSQTPYSGYPNYQQIQYPVNQQAQSYTQNQYMNPNNQISFDFSRFRIKNMYSLIAAVILICSFFMGSVFNVLSEYSETVKKFNLKKATEAFETSVTSKKLYNEDVSAKEWIASKTMMIIIAVIVILILGSFIDLNIIRIISLVVLTIAYLCMFGTVVEYEVTPGFCFIVLLAGIITGYISCAENGSDEKKNVVYKEFKLSADSSRQSNDNWKCIECGKVNPKYLTTCKCGTSKADSQSRSSIN